MLQRLIYAKLLNKTIKHINSFKEVGGTKSLIHVCVLSDPYYLAALKYISTQITLTPVTKKQKRINLRCKLELESVKEQLYHTYNMIMIRGQLEKEVEHYEKVLDDLFIGDTGGQLRLAPIKSKKTSYIFSNLKTSWKEC